MLSKRLKILASYIKKDDKVGDIGTDHGFIPIYLLKNNIIDYVIASDLNEDPLKNAKQEISKEGLLDNVDLRLGSGLNPYKLGEIDTAIIAGMGGKLIRQILKDNKNHLKHIDKLILQPMKGTYNLRKWLLENGYELKDEKLIKEKGIFYEIIYAKKDKVKPYDKKILEFGRNMLKKGDPVSLEYIDKKIDKFEQIVKNISNHGGSMSQDKKQEFIDKLDVYKEVKECLSTQKK
ncbi:MAG: tRNA (adenine(22)-N(1))-methyltransferase [Bacillota bacterium]